MKHFDSTVPVRYLSDKNPSLTACSPADSAADLDALRDRLGLLHLPVLDTHLPEDPGALDLESMGALSALPWAVSPFITWSGLPTE